MMEVKGFVTLHHPSVKACFDESLPTQVADFSISTLSLSFFSQYVMGPVLSPPEKAASEERNTAVTKVGDEARLRWLTGS